LESLELAKNAVKLAGAYLLSNKTKDFTIKTDGSPVTFSEKEAEKITRQELQKLNIPIISEEDDPMNLPKKYWLLDPLDGTKNYLRGERDYSVLISLVDNNEPVLGVVYFPEYEELYFAQKGSGAFIEKEGKIQRIKTSNTEQIFALLSKNHLLKSEIDLIQKCGINNYGQIGSSGIKICQIAKGAAQLYVNLDGLSIWDIMAPALILEEAGGVLSDKNGNKISYEHVRLNKGIIVSNGEKVHNQIISQIKKEGKLIWITGLSGAGKTTIAKKVFEEYKKENPNSIHLDGDSLREILGNHFGHTIEERKKIALIYSRICSALTSQGINVIISTISMFHEIHEYNRNYNKRYYEIYLEVPVEELHKRDQKGLYTNNKSFLIGINQEAEFPKKPTIKLVNSDEEHIEKNVEVILELIKK